MAKYTVLINPNGGYAEDRVKITEEGAKLIWAAYVKLYGHCQTMERREERGGIAYTSEIEYWKSRGALPADFDWTKYKIEI